MKVRLLFISLGLLIASSATNAAVAVGSVYQVILPKVQVNPHEAIEKVEITITCARWVAIVNIPDDWIISATNPMSAVSEFSAEAGHGSSEVTNPGEVQHLVDIRIVEPKCFDIKATIHTIGVGRGGKHHVFSGKQIKLVKVLK